MAVTKRSTKGAALTHAEMDGNWNELLGLLTRLSTYVASETPAAKQIVVTRADSSIVLPGAIYASGDVLVGTLSKAVYTAAGRAVNVAASAGAVRLALQGATTSDYAAIDFGSGAQRNAVVQGNSDGSLTILTNAIPGVGSVTERFRITSAGNIGVGTSNPTEKLEVLGNVKVSGLKLGGGPVPMTVYDEGTFVATATGMEIQPSGAVEYVRNGNQITLDIPSLSGTSNATTFTLMGLPSNLIPLKSKACPIRVIDNSFASVWGVIQIGSSGTITLFKGPEGSVFTASGVKGVVAGSITYTLR